MKALLVSINNPYEYKICPVCRQGLSLQNSSLENFEAKSYFCEKHYKSSSYSHYRCNERWGSFSQSIFLTNYNLTSFSETDYSLIYNLVFDEYNPFGSSFKIPKVSVNQSTDLIKLEKRIDLIAIFS